MHINNLPQAEQYGAPEPQLVPSGLRCYRHFKLYRNEGGNSGYLGACTSSTIYGPNDGETYTAQCRPAAAVPIPLVVGDVPIHKRRYVPSFPAAPKHPDTPSPQVDCKCGFYASYAPETDFYLFTSGYWSAPAEQWTHAWIHAVVEVSGRTLMGTAGVRAEKMRIIAFCVDRRKNWHLKTHEAAIEAEALAVRVAGAHGVPFYDDKAAMHAAYPQPDISHLMED